MILSVCPNPSIDTYAWLENLYPGHVNRIEKIKEYPGGKGTHVALALAELGAQSKIMGNWAGASGEWIKKACSEKNVAISGVQLHGNNRKCYTFISEYPTFDNTEILEPGPSLETTHWDEFKKVFKQEISSASLICMSGSWPKNAPVTAYRELIELANAQNKKVLLDCSGPQLKEALKSSFFGLHLNEHEAKELCGSADFEAVRTFLKDKVELVALTKGKDGLQLSYKDEVFTANVTLENVISTVGSGDCLMAGLAFALEKDMNPDEIAGYGVACGAANCVTEALGMLEKETVEELLPEVQVDKGKSVQ